VLVNGNFKRVPCFCTQLRPTGWVKWLGREYIALELVTAGEAGLSSSWPDCSIKECVWLEAWVGFSALYMCAMCGLEGWCVCSFSLIVRRACPQLWICNVCCLCCAIKSALFRFAQLLPNDLCQMEALRCRLTLFRPVIMVAFCTSTSLSHARQ